MGSRIEVLMIIGFGVRVRPQQEMCNLFNASHANRPPITRSTISKIESKFVEHGQVKDLPKEDQYLRILKCTFC